MGSGNSVKDKQVMKPEMLEEERKKRQRLDQQVRKMQRSLRVTATAHYISSEHYRKWNHRLQYTSYLTGVLGTTGTVSSTLAWKMIVAKYPRLALILGSASATSVVFTFIANFRLPNSPANLHQLHFKSGIECQYLEKRVQFFAESDVWNSSVPWTTLASNYENLLKTKKEVNSRIQTEEWAYRAALEKIENREKEKREKENEF